MDLQRRSPGFTATATCFRYLPGPCMGPGWLACRWKHFVTVKDAYGLLLYLEMTRKIAASMAHDFGDEVLEAGLRLKLCWAGFRSAAKP